MSHQLWVFENRMVRGMTSKRMRWAGHAARMGEKRNAYRILNGKSYRNVFVVMLLHLAAMHHVVHECIYHKVIISAGDTTCAICLSFCAMYFAYMRLPSG